MTDAPAFVPPDARRSLRAETPDGVEIAICEWGNPNGQAIVLIHGISQSMLCFAPQLRSALAGEFRLISWDMRGHGDSDKPVGPEFYAESRRWADELATVIAATSARRPVVVGWSMGGRVLMQYLMHYGDAALGALNFVSARIFAEARFSGPAVLTPSAAGATDLGRRILTATAFLEGCFDRPLPPGEFAFALGYNLATPGYVLAGIPGLPPAPEETVAALKALRVPVLITHGAKDRVVLPACAGAVADHVPGARLSIYDTSGHSPFREDTTRFNAELADLARMAAEPRE